MASLESFHLEHLPADCVVHVAVFNDVKNAPFLRSQLLAGNQEFEYALVDASVILSRTHVLAAAYRAVVALLSESLKSRNVHSEIVLSLSTSNNIAESFRRFGISDKSKSLVIVKVALHGTPTSETVQQHLASAIEGQQVEFSDAQFSQMVDLALVRKLYKLDASPKKKAAAQVPASPETEKKELELAVLAGMALRGAL